MSNARDLVNNTEELLTNTPATDTELGTTNTRVSTAESRLDTAEAFAATKAQLNGLASLDGSGLVPSAQLPSYVDDILEYATYSALPAIGETGKIYIVVADETSGGDTSTYRWTGSVYAIVSNSLTAADIEALYEGLPDTNKYTDAQVAIVDDAVTKAGTQTISGAKTFTEKMAMTFTDDVANVAYTGMDIIHNISGADVLTADRIHKAINVTVTSDATGGDTTNEHRVFGQYTNVVVTGDSDLIYGNQSISSARQSAGTVTSNFGVYGYAQADNLGGQVSNNYGGYFLGYDADAGLCVDNYAVWCKANKQAGSTQTTTNLVGLFAEVQMDAGIATNGYAVQALIDNNLGASAITNAVLFKGGYEGTLPTGAKGIEILSDVPSELGGGLTIGGDFVGTNITLNGEILADNACTSWINFNGSTPPVIADSYNVSSVTRSNTGIYIVNFAQSMLNTNYSCVVSSRTTLYQVSVAIIDVDSVQISIRNDAGTYVDTTEIFLHVFGGR